MFKIKRIIENNVIAIVELLQDKWYAYWYESVEDLKRKKIKCILIDKDKKQELIHFNPIIAYNNTDLSGVEFCKERDKKIQEEIDKSKNLC